ncbi:restriction endonuclease subunit S [Rhizobium brockwellii]|uniref:Restriction endonuclease subunit S n=1 Tax=Rhizobium brockwellii TaxID=3019932 RepID=A0ABU3YMU1_9HYPH|nr:restriction endonuclease subunit S [Rhizobium brockwellii]MDV4180212.1 restriction endonuclease subunit S [Rhizobium brockwellii]MDV4187134.1 restriction endonuclease subunit S [Rhizobium brockwellii]
MSHSLPGDWRPISFGGIARDVSSRNRDRNDIPVLSVTKYDGFVPSQEYFKKKVFSADTENYKIVRRGQFAYATIHLDEGSIDRLTEFDAGLISPMYTVFQLDEGQADPEFVLRLFKLFSSNGRFDALGNGGVNRRKSISFSTLSKLELALPPLHEQRRIAEILSSVDDAIEATREVIEQTRKVKQSALEHLLTKGVGHTRFKQTEIGEIPEGWEIVTLGDVAVQGSGLQTGPFGSQLKAQEYVNDGIPIVMPRDIVSGSISTQQIAMATAAKANDLRIHKLQAGDLVFARRGDIGRFGLISHKEEGFLCGTGCLRARLDVEKIHPQFASAYLQSPFPIEWLNTNAVGQTMLNLNTSIISRLPLPLPKLNEQTVIIGSAEAIASSLRVNTQKLERLVALKSALMSDLLTGRRRVTDVLPMAAE